MLTYRVDMTHLYCYALPLTFLAQNSVVSPLFTTAPVENLLTPSLVCYTAFLFPYLRSARAVAVVVASSAFVGVR